MKLAFGSQTNVSKKIDCSELHYFSDIISGLFTRLKNLEYILAEMNTDLGGLCPNPIGPTPNVESLRKAIKVC